MPVTIYPSSQPIKGVHSDHKDCAANNAHELLISSLNKSLSDRCGEIFQCSFTNSSDHGPERSSPVNAAFRVPSKRSEEQPSLYRAAGRFAATDLSIHPVIAASHGNGFVHATMQAYNHHHALILRPDDVWMAILTQFNLFCNAHAQELRSVFVEHEGQKELTIRAGGNRWTVDFGEMTKQMSILLHENIVDEGLRDWIIPDFSTTNENDRITSSVIMMATLKAYFRYQFMLLCGIPRVTLLGEKADWEKLVSKIDRLKKHGPETTQWSELLRPVLVRFASSFDSPDSDATKAFWQRIAHEKRGGSGPDKLSGWVTAFCFFSDKGQCMRNAHQMESMQSNLERYAKDLDSRAQRDPWDAAKVLQLDGVLYHSITTNSIPPAVADVNVKLDDNGDIFPTIMAAGLVGVRVEDSGIKHGGHDGIMDTVRPEAGWWLFEDKERGSASSTNE